MKILITGGTGYIGRFLCKELLGLGYELGVISRTVKKWDGIACYAFSGRLEDLKLIFDEFKPDKVIHLAADVSKKISSDTIEHMLQVNILLPAYLLQLSEEYGIRQFVNISTFSTSVDGKTYSPQTYYAATKKSIEDLAIFYSLRTELPVVTLCFYDIYGPGQHHDRFLNVVMRALCENKELHMSLGEQEICLLNVHDAVDAIIYALNMRLERYRVYRYCVYGLEVFKLKEVPAKIADYLNRECVEVIHDLPYRDSEIMNFCPPYPLLEGWEAKITLRDGVNKYWK